jgi:hypothetical protein
MFCALIALAGCGKKGDPDPPVPDNFPHQYPQAEELPELKSSSGIPVLPKPEQQPSPLTPFQTSP